CHLWLTADRDWRAQRMALQQGWSLADAESRCAEEDRVRARFTRYFFGPEALQPASYDLVVNTSRVALEEGVAGVGAVGGDAWPAPPADRPSGPRVLTLARELGAADRDLVPTLAARLGLHVYGRAELEQELARRLLPGSEPDAPGPSSPGFFQ